MSELKLDPKIYNDFIGEIEIKNIKLNSLRIDDVNDELAENSNLSLSLKFDNKQFSKNGDILNIYSKFFVGVKNEEDGTIKNGFNIEFTYKLEYYIENIDRFSDEYIRLFAIKNVPVNVWPYARELISSLTTRIGYPTLIIEPLKTR